MAPLAIPARGSSPVLSNALKFWIPACAAVTPDNRPLEEKTISPLEEKTSGVLHSAEVIPFFNGLVRERYRSAQIKQKKRTAMNGDPERDLFPEKNLRSFSGVYEPLKNAGWEKISFAKNLRSLSGGGLRTGMPRGLHGGVGAVGNGPAGIDLVPPPAKILLPRLEVVANGFQCRSQLFVQRVLDFCTFSLAHSVFHLIGVGLIIQQEPGAGQIPHISISARSDAPVFFPWKIVGKGGDVHDQHRSIRACRPSSDEIRKVFALHGFRTQQPCQT